MTNEVKTQNALVATSMQVGSNGLQLKTLADMKLVAETLIASGLIPTHFNTVPKVIYALQCGYDLGLKMTQSLQELHIVNGKMGMSAKLMAGLIHQSGVCTNFNISYEGKEYNDDFKAVVTAKRYGSGDELRTEFSVADAKRACLWNKAGSWTTYPKDMLTNRAISRQGRFNFSDVTGGLYTVDELQDIEVPAEQATPEIPPREERKQAEDVKITTTTDVAKQEFEKFVKMFTAHLIIRYGVEYNIEDEAQRAELMPIIAKFVQVTLKHENPPTIEEIKILRDTVNGVGLPEEVVALVPGPFDKSMAEGEAK